MLRSQHSIPSAKTERHFRICRQQQWIEVDMAIGFHAVGPTMNADRNRVAASLKHVVFKAELILSSAFLLCPPEQTKKCQVSKWPVQRKLVIALIALSALVLSDYPVATLHTPSCGPIFHCFFLILFGSTVGVNLAPIMKCGGVRTGREEDWNFVWEQFKSNKIASEKYVLLRAVTCTRDPAILTW